MNRFKIKDYKIEYEEGLNSDVEAILSDGISDEAVIKKSMSGVQPFTLSIKAENSEILGGATGYIFYGSLYLDMLWLKKELRKKGFGKKLLFEAENIARKLQCSFATLNTMDWEALPFYQSLGYEIEFVREGYNNHSKMYLLRKKLT